MSFHELKNILEVLKITFYCEIMMTCLQNYRLYNFTEYVYLGDTS